MNPLIMKSLLAVLLGLHLTSYTLAQEPETKKHYRSRLTQNDFFKVDAGQLIMLEFGLNYEHNFKGLWSATAGAGINRASLFYSLDLFENEILFNDFYSQQYKWGYFFSAGVRRYFNKYNEPSGLYCELEGRYKKWSMQERDPKHGGPTIRYFLEDIQIVPIVGWVPNRSHWFEVYLGLGIVNTFGNGEGKKWVGTGNGENGSAFVMLDESINFTSIRPKMGFRFCF